MPPCLFFHVMLEILSFIFHLSWCTIRKQAFCDWNVAKSIKIYPDYKVVPWKYQVVLEILRWCWKIKRVVLHRSKMGRGEHCSRYMLTKLPKTITLVRKRWFFSKDGQENCLWYQYQVICHTILYSLVTTTFRYQQMTIQKWPWESCMTKGPLLTLLSVIKTHTRDINSLLWPFFWQYQLFYDGWSFYSTASFLWVK